MKKPEVCEGCRHHDKYNSIHELKGTCAFHENTGKSRLKIEMDNGGYKEDSCICYDTGKHVHKFVKPRL